MRHFMNIGRGLKFELIDEFKDLAKVISTLNLVGNFRENFADLVLECVRSSGGDLELCEIRKEFTVYKVS